MRWRAGTSTEADGRLGWRRERGSSMFRPHSWNSQRHARLALPLSIAIVACSAVSCGGDVEEPGNDVELAPCVAPAAAPGDCKTHWEIVDPCEVGPSAAAVEVAVFSGACPDDSMLQQGDDSEAVQRQFVQSADDFEPIDNLSQSSFGFAILLRNDACNVVASGCTNADLEHTTKILTAVRPELGPQSCEAKSTGSCPDAETCKAGVCE